MNEANQRIAITTSQPRTHLIELALLISSDLKIKYITKNKMSVEKIKEKNNINCLIIVREDRLQVITEDNNEFFFHPGLSIPRIKNFTKGEVDSMACAMDLKLGDSVLDCTVGLANDAIVASFIVGEQGKVIGLESNPIIHLITKLGLQNYQRGSKSTQEAMRRIDVFCAYYEDVLYQLENNSFDVVYFDPMFKNPILKSSGIHNLRTFANYQQLTEDIINQARKISRKRVVIKDRIDGHIFSKLGADEISGGKYSSIQFGVFYKNQI